MTDAIQSLSALIALIYHEARYARIVATSANARWSKLRSIPHERYAAWNAIRPIRERAAASASGEDAARVFEEEYSVPFSDLTDVFEAIGQTARTVGGEKWMMIAAEVSKLIGTFDGMSNFDLHIELKRIESLKHNTGSLHEKLLTLDRA